MFISITITEQFTFQGKKNNYKNSHLIEHSCVTAQ